MSGKMHIMVPSIGGCKFSTRRDALIYFAHSLSFKFIKRKFSSGLDGIMHICKKKFCIFFICGLHFFCNCQEEMSIKQWLYEE